MSKNKVRESGSSTKKEKIHWRLQLQQLDINTIRKDRAIEVVVLNECLSRYFDDIAKFQKLAYTNTCDDVKPIIYEEILYIISHYPAWSRPYIESDVENMIKEACAEAKSYIKIKKPIPLDMMADLIKLRIIMLIEEDIYNEKLRRMHLLDETMSTDLSDSYESASNSSTEEYEKIVENSIVEQKVEEKDDWKDNEFVSDPNIQSTTYTNINPRDFETVDVFFNNSSIVLQEYMRTQRKWLEVATGTRRSSSGFTPVIKPDELSIPKRKRLRTPWSIRLCKSLKEKKDNIHLNMQDDTQFEDTKLLYIVLTGFYDPYLVISLYKAGVPISCVITIAMKDDKPLDPTEVTRIKRFCLAQPFSIAPVYNYSLQCLYTQSKNVIRICDLGYDDMKEQLIYHFCNTIDELCVSNYEILKDLIGVTCPPVNYRGVYVKLDSPEYIEQSKTIFDNIKQLLYKLPVIKKWYKDYISSLLIIDLGNTPKIIPANEMFYYNDTLDKLPPDCYSVGLTVEGLLEEVEQKDSGSKEMVPRENKLARTKKHDKLLKIRKFCNKFFNKYRFKSLPADFLSFYQKYRTNFLLLRKKPCCPERFEITEDNILELNATYYPRFAENICKRTLSDLKKSMPFALRKLADDMQRTQTESIFSSNQHHTWSSFLRLSPQETNERLEICMFNLLKCEYDNTKAELFCELYKCFPNMSTQSDISVLINHDVGPQSPCLFSLENVYEDYDEASFEWQEKIKADLLLQKLERYRSSFKCMDYEYVPFLDSVIMRFHDKCDNFGISTEAWKEGLRSQVGMRDFFKSTIFEDPCALLLSHMQTCKSCKMTLMRHAIKQPLTVNTVNTKLEESITSIPLVKSSHEQSPAPKSNIGESSLITPPYLVNAFNLHRRCEVKRMSTLFHSLDGLKITVDKTFLFSAKPCLTLKLEISRHNAFMYVQQHKDSKFMFHIEAPNGARVVFSPSERRIFSNSCKVIKTQQPHPEKQRYYNIKEIETIGFGQRLCLYEMHLLNELSLLRILNAYLPIESRSSTETLQLLDFRKSIVLKPTVSLTDMRWRYNVPKVYSAALKAIKKTKQESTPHFKVISTALHRYRYIQIAPLEIKIVFADGEKKLKYIPNLTTKKKIEITKCLPLLPKLRDSWYQSDQSCQENRYDTRLSLPNGLQIAAEPGKEAGSMHIVQYYIPNNPNMPKELSRTFTQNGYIQIRYNDGTVKMIGIQGRCVMGELPCSPVVLKTSRKERKCNTDLLKNRAIKKYMKLQKSILHKIYRYQSKFLHLPAKSNLRIKRKRKKIDSTEFENMGSSLLRNSLTIDNQYYPFIDFYIQKNCFKDYFTLDIATNDSHSSINDDGELITIYADGTKITSCWKIDLEMIVVDETQAEILEIDPDDYTCNFLIPKVGGWISVSLFYQYEHPQYASVVCYGKKETCIRLPDMEYKTDVNGNFVVNTKEVFTHVTKDDIKISSNYCTSCHKYCETMINVKNLWSHDAEIKDDDILLEAKDTFNKVFTVSYRGICTRNDQYQSGSTNSNCPQHKISDTQKFLVFDKHFDGKMFWNKHKLRSKLIDVQNGNDLKTRDYLDENGNLKVYDFIKYHHTHHSDRFLMEYRHPNPSIFNDQFQKCLRKIIYTTKRQISTVPDYRQVLPLFSLIRDLKIRYAHELPLPKFENIFELEEYLHPKSLQIKSSSTDTIHMKLSPLFGEVVVDNFRKLMKKVEKFEVGAHENIENFEKSLQGNNESSYVSDECSETYFIADKPTHVVHPKVLYHKILKHTKQKHELSSSCRKKKSNAARASNLEPPPVPKNSHTSIICQDVPLVSDTYGQRMVSHSEFIRNVNKDLVGTEKSVAQKQMEIHHDKFSANILEWRKPISVVETGSLINYPLKNTSKRAYRTNQDKEVCTTTPFDLFFDNSQEIQDYITAKAKIPTSSSSKLPKSQKYEKVLSYDATWQQFDNYGKSIRRSETLSPENKQSKLITGVQAIESYNQVYDTFKTLYKDTPRDMKRFTELPRTVGEKQSLRRITSVTELQMRENFLPLILSPIRKASSRQIVKNESSETDLTKSEILSSLNTIKDENNQSRTLQHLSYDSLRDKEKPLKHVPPEIDQVVLGRFYANLPGRSESECTSVSVKGSLDVQCQFVKKDCLCPSTQHINGKPERSEMKAISKSNNRKISKFGNK